MLGVVCHLSDILHIGSPVGRIVLVGIILGLSNLLPKMRLVIKNHNHGQPWYLNTLKSFRWIKAHALILQLGS